MQSAHTGRCSPRPSNYDNVKLKSAWTSDRTSETCCFLGNHLFPVEYVCQFPSSIWKLNNTTVTKIPGTDLGEDVHSCLMILRVLCVPKFLDSTRRVTCVGNSARPAACPLLKSKRVPAPHPTFFKMDPASAQNLQRIHVSLVQWRMSPQVLWFHKAEKCRVQTILSFVTCIRKRDQEHLPWQGAFATFRNPVPGSTHSKYPNALCSKFNCLLTKCILCY